jgi:hypothetical protein
MNTLWNRCGGLIALLLCAGCASGPRYAETVSALPPIGSGNGRIYIYRPSSVGALVQPNVRLNGEKIGKSVPEGFFCVDRPPGQYEIEVTTEVKRTLSLSLEAGQTRYVRLDLELGYFVCHFAPVPVPPLFGELEIGKCRYIHRTLTEDETNAPPTVSRSSPSP